MDCLRKMQMAEDYTKACTESMVNEFKREVDKYMEKNPDLVPYREDIEAILDLAPVEKRLPLWKILTDDEEKDTRKALSKMLKLLEA